MMKLRTSPVATDRSLTSNPAYLSFGKFELEPNPSYQSMEIAKTHQS